MIDERMRHELFLRLEGVLGPEEAATLMSTFRQWDGPTLQRSMTSSRSVPS